MGEIVNFAKALDADSAQMEAIYRIAEERSLFIKFKSEEAMLHALTFNPEDLIFHYADGKEAKVQMSHAGELIQYVRVFDLPPEVADHELASVLGKYGKVKRIIREKFPVELCFDLYTGVRGVFMDVKKPIPTSLHFLNRKGNIFYEGNKDKCFLCQKEGHRMNSCPQRKTRKQPDQQENEKGSSSTSTYAGVVSGVSTISTDEEAEGETEVREEEMVIDATSPGPVNNSVKETNGTTELPVFKHPNDEYYFRKFGILNFTEQQEKQHAMEQQTAAEATRQHPKKIKKNS